MRIRDGRAIVLAVALVLGGQSSALAAKAKSPAPDLILYNAAVIGMDAPGAVFDAVAVREGKIVARGTDAEISALAGRKTRSVDLHDQAVLPGFIDAHGHLTILARNVDMASVEPPPIGKASTIAGVIAILKDQAARHPTGTIAGFGYDDAMLAEKRHPTRQELDEVSVDRPLVLIHQSHHLATLNTKALEILGMLQPMPDPAGGKIWRDDKGIATGLIEERAMHGAMALLPKATGEAAQKDIARALEIYASYGVTTVQDGATQPDQFQLLQQAADKGLLTLDVDVLLYNGSKWPDKPALLLQKDYKNHLRVAGIKQVLDGSLQGRTGWLSQPYYTTGADQPADFRGYRQVEDKTLIADLTEAARNGWRVFTHVNGDAAIQQLLDAVAVVNASGTRLNQPVAIHSQYVRKDQLQRMLELGVTPSFFASHTFFWGDWHRDAILGPVRADGISPQRSAIDIGLKPTAHNDAPVVTPDIMRLVWSSVTRRTRSGDILGPAERITPFEALSEVTINAALQMDINRIKGTISPGKMADLVILAKNPLTADPETLDKIAVVATIKEGKVVYGKLPD